MIKKSIFIPIFFLLSFTFANDTVLQANIKYNEASAKVEAFKDLERKISKDFYKDHLKDPNYEVNRAFLEKEKFIIENKRTLCPFYFKKILISYAVTYNNNPLVIYYYNSLGSLIRFDIVSDENYPRKTLGYSKYGNIISVIFEADEKEQFVYNENGKLIAHWENNEMKNKDGKIPKVMKITRGALDIE